MRRLAVVVGLILLVLPWVVYRQIAARPAGDQPSSPVVEVSEGGGSSSPNRLPDLGRGPLPDDPVMVRNDGTARHGVLAGEVLCAQTNEPVAGAELTFGRGERVSSVITNSAGFFTYEANQPGEHRLVSVTAEGFFPFAPQWGHSPLRMVAQEDRRIDNAVVYLEPATTWRGVVVDPTGQRVPEAEITVLSSRHARSSLLGPAGEVTDEQGLFTLQAPLGALVEARHEGFLPARLRLTRGLSPDRPLLLRLGPQSGPDQGNGTIAGRVLAESGAPLRDALVSARLLARRGSRPLPVSAVAGEEGEFLLEGLVPGPYYLEAQVPGWQPGRQRPVEAGADNVELVLRRGPTLTGSVIDRRTGRPVPGFSVVIERPYGPLRRLPYRSETFFDPEGRFEISGLENFQYVVTVRAQGYPPSEGYDVALQGDQGADILVSLSSGGEARGSVVDSESGQPVAGAHVIIEGPRGRSPGLPVSLSAKTITDYGGGFRISGLSPGRRSLLVRAEGYHERILSALDVRADDVVPDLHIELRPQGADEDRELDLVGIGAVLIPRGEGLVIVRVLEEGGASAAGLAPGDAIFFVDGRPVTDLGFSGAVEHIRGEEGTVVRLGVRRRQGQGPEDIAVARVRVRG